MTSTGNHLRCFAMDFAWFRARIRFFSLTVSALTIFIISSQKMAWACPMCSELVERGKDALKSMQFGQGIAWSMVLMFSVPVAMIGGMGWVVYRHQKKQARAAARNHD